MNTENQAITLDQLSPEAKKQLLADLKKEENDKKNAKAENIAAYKELTHEFVNKNVDVFINRQLSNEADIKRLFVDYKDVMKLKAMTYGDKVLEQDTHTSTLPDGSASITIGYNVNIGFDGTEQVGIKGIKDYMTSLTDDNENTQKLKSMVNVFLKESKKTGMLNPANIIQLNSLRAEMNSESFNENLDIIIAAQIRNVSTMFASGWKVIEGEEGMKRKIEFRFSI